MAEDHGITVPEQDCGADTEFPTNVDDQDLTETQTTPAQPLPRWTETTFILILSEIKSMWVPIIRAGAQAEALFTELKTRLHDRYLQYAHMDIPIQRQGVMVAQVLISKLEIQTVNRPSSAGPRQTPIPPRRLP
jgi:ribosomal protein S12 methylthiotransferase accessory factor YcaO